MVGFSRILQAGLAASAGLALLSLAACSDYSGALPKHMRPLDQKTRELVERKGMEQRSPILIRLFKEEAVLEVWKPQKSTGRYALLKTYEVCAWSGVLGPKIKEGDRQAPEGFYTIRPAQMNPDSSYHLAFNMGYPNDFDRAHGRTGSELMVHGACSSRGCYSMTDESIQEIYTLGRLAFQGGQRDFQVQAFPFRMTPENLARHSDNPNMPFWVMLKEGYDHFDAVGQPPKVDVCDRRYVFNSVPSENGSFIPTAACPPMSMPDAIRIALADKEAKDQERLLAIATKLDKQGKSRGAEALRLALAAPTSTQLAAPMSIAIAPAAVGIAAKPDPSPAAPPMTASIDTAPAAPAATVESVPVPQPRPQPVAAAAATTQPARAPAPAASGSTFLALPTAFETEAAAAPDPAAPAAAVPSDAVSLEERMLVGTAQDDDSVADAYSTAEEEAGLTGLVLRLYRQE
jgi:murein L,D-transpeptidase YafK